MSYIALYRKFRPDSFDEVKGQDHIVTTLKNQIKADRVGHAYLFCGTRGTGKTTMAKLLAKTVNCENPTENGPCGVCPSCKAIADGSSLNVMEIDAASNNGVDNIRQINETVQYSPAQGKYLVYIIDEVHMLSAGAYNALLKTLEEPPEYVIFILATTDEHKLPVTIKSRCQRYDFHRISIETITDRLEDIVSREGGKATRDALSFIARTADGSMRDALSILDECMSAAIGEELTRDGVLKTIGAVSVDIYMDMMSAIKADDANRVLSIISETIYNGKDLTKFVDDFTWFMRNVLFLKLSPSLKGELDITEEAAGELLELGKEFSTETLSRYLTILQELCSSIRMSSVKRVTLEMAMIKMMHPETDDNYEAVIGRLERLEQGHISGNVNASINVTSEGGAAEESKAAAQSTPDGEDASSQTPNSRSVLNDVDMTMLESIIDKKLDQKVDEEIKRRIKSGELAMTGETKLDPKEESELVIKNIRENFPPAVAKDIEALASKWNTEVVAKLEHPFNAYTEYFNVEPSPEYSDDGIARLRLVFDEKDKESVAYGFLSKEQYKSKLADRLSEIIEKKVEIDIVTKKITKGIPDRTTQALNKINFKDIMIVDEE